MTHHRLGFLDRPDAQYLDPEAEDGEGSSIRLRSMAERAALVAEHLGSVNVDSAMGESLHARGPRVDESVEEE